MGVISPMILVVISMTGIFINYTKMILVNSRVERMIQAMAGFGTQSTGGVIGSTPDDSKNQWQLAPNL